MAKTLRSKKRNRRWVIPVLLFALLLTAAGIVLYRFHPSLQDIGRKIQAAVGNISRYSAGQSPAEPVLRGTIYDRRFSELAVSYRMFTLFVRPAEMEDSGKTAEKLSRLIGIKAEAIDSQLKSATSTVELTDDLDEVQALQINALQLKGVYCKASEARFYPGHAAASHVIGFMEDSVGLAGVEGKYNMVLQPGTFQRNNIPDVDFQDKESLGGSGTDMVLTLDFALQKQLEARFREYLAAHGAEKGMGLLLEPGSGRILALVNQPSFNPNYFWKAKESNRVNRIYNHVLDKELIRTILFRAAAIEREGLQGPGLLPETIAAPNYGFSNENLEAFEKQIQLYGSVFGNWEAKSDIEPTVEAPAVTGVQVGVTLASLVNGGWRITPYVVDSIYDHATKTRYRRSNEATERSHVLDPALGVKLRRELFTKWLVDQEDMIVFAADHAQIKREKDLSRYSIQDLFVGLAPAKQPKYLLLMAVEQDHLYPDLIDTKRENVSLTKQGKELLTVLVKDQGGEEANGMPPSKSQENRRQFFISKRLNLNEPAEKAGEVAAVMPALRGMSLRKGLQRLNPHKVLVKVNGSGTIVAQYPLPGATLRGVNECVLTLNSK